MKCTGGRVVRFLVCLHVLRPSPVISDVILLKLAFLNPYSPSKICEPTSRFAYATFAWNIIVGLALIALAWLTLDLLRSHYKSWIVPANGLPGAWPPFVAISLQDATVSCGLAAFLVALSTIRLHRHPWMTRCSAVFVCTIVWFDFSSLAFTQELAMRSAVFLAMISPMLVFGCGYPHLLSNAVSLISSRPSG